MTVPVSTASAAGRLGRVEGCRREFAGSARISTTLASYIWGRRRGCLPALTSRVVHGTGTRLGFGNLIIAWDAVCRWRGAPPERDLLLAPWAGGASCGLPDGLPGIRSRA